MSKDTSLARREEVRRQRQHECFCVCVQGVGAGEVSSSVALHLTSILITAFQQRSSSQPLPQSNGLTREASLHSRASPDLLLLLLHTHARTHKHTHTHENVVSFSCYQGESGGSRSVLPQQSLQGLGSSCTGDTTSYHQPAPTHHHRWLGGGGILISLISHLFSLPLPLPSFFQYRRINLKGVNWKIK